MSELQFIQKERINKGWSCDQKKIGRYDRGF